MSRNEVEIILIGCSAGGLQAVIRIFEGIRKALSVPVVLVQHRSKEPKDLLEEVLQNRLSQTIKQADEKEKVLPGIIYVAPPDYHLLMEADKTFSLSSDEQVLYSRPSIDVCFESVAAVYRNKVLAILLTGANKDGSNGLLAVKKFGGKGICQDPKEADFSIMPAGAIENKAVDHVMKLAEINHLLTQFQL